MKREREIYIEKRLLVQPGLIVLGVGWIFHDVVCALVDPK